MGRFVFLSLILGRYLFFELLNLSVVDFASIFGRLDREINLPGDLIVMEEEARELLEDEKITVARLINLLNYLIENNGLDAATVPVEMADGESVCAIHFVDGRIIITDRLDTKKWLKRAKRLLKGTTQEHLIKEIAENPKRFLVAAGDIQYDDIPWASNFHTLEEGAAVIESMECDTSDGFTAVDLETGKKFTAAMAMRVSFE